MFTPVKLGNTTLPPEVLKADKKSCKRYGPCGVGEQALYLNSFFIDRRYYVALESVRRVFKRVAMSKGGFTGKGAFGSIPYLVVELDDGSQKQCNFKHEEDVDLLLAHMARVCPDIPRHSVEAERRLREKAEREAKRYLKQLTPQAQAARETLEQAQQLLEEYPEQTVKLSTAAKAKRVNDRSNPAYRWVALAIIVAGIAAVREQQMIFHFSLRPHAVQPVFQNLFFVVTASVHRRLLLRDFNTLRLRRQEHYHVVCPVETAVKALPLHIIVVSGNQHDDRLRDGSKEIINLFQFPQKRLALKQISRNQQKVRLFPTGQADDPPEALPDGLPSLLAPGKSRIRLHAEMHIRNMNKPHRRIPLSGFIFSITTIRTSGAPNPHWIPLHPASVFFKFLYHFS